MLCYFQSRERWRGLYVKRTSVTSKRARGIVVPCCSWIERGGMLGAGARCRCAVIEPNRPLIEIALYALANERMLSLA